MSDALLQYLVSERMVTVEQAQTARDAAGGKHATPLHALIASGLVNEAALQKTLSQKFSVPVVQLSRVQMAATRLLPSPELVKLRCLPFQIDPDQSVRVAIADPTDTEALGKVRKLIGKPVIPMLTTFSALEHALKAISEPAPASAPVTLKPRTEEEAPARTTAPRESVAGTKSTPSVIAPPPTRQSSSFIAKVKIFRATDTVVNILNEVMVDGVAKGASDIHIEPEPSRVRIRFRLEGVLFDVYQVPIELRDQLTSRMKVMASLDISERRVPQDGRAKLKVGNEEVGFRVNIMPSLNGENIVLRLLRQDNLQFDLMKLGFDPKQQEIFRRAVAAPNGMILVTGPTGSGKTTTLYSALSALNESTVKIATVEDPVEYNLPGITQVQINKDTGLDFAEALKSLLRQDPDVILVGEVRDQETAKVAVQAALTGHIVFSSLHTNDAPGAIIRLLNMGVETFALLESIRTVVAQRLVRRICLGCAVPAQVGEEQLRFLGADRVLLDRARLMRGAGCERCLGGGYSGRSAIFEVVELTDPLKEMFLKGENLISVRRRAIADGMTTLRQSALRLAGQGVTSLEEAISATLEQ